MIRVLQGAAATNFINATIRAFASPLSGFGFFMSLASDRNVGNFLKIHFISPDHSSPVEIWLQACYDTDEKINCFQSYRNFTLVRTFPTMSLLRNGYPIYREVNRQTTFRTSLQSLSQVDFDRIIVDWDNLVEANEYRRQVPEFNPAATTLRDRMYA
jgi:hypothetical protein